jgi:hypothetical protein
MSDIDKLTEMVNGYPKQIQDMEEQIDSLNEIITDLTEQQQAIENEVLAPLTVDSNTYGDAKAVSFGPTHSFCTSGAYGVSNLTEWAVVDGDCLGIHTVVWTSDDVSPSVDAEQYYRQVDFAEAYGHIHDEVGENGTYGIADNKSNITTGKNIITTNKDKIETVQAIYEQFI